MHPSLLGGVLLGWSLGGNDTANVFGTAVSASMVRFRTAALLIALFVLLGALSGGRPGMETLAGLTGQSFESAFLVTMTAALTIIVMTVGGIPVSTSQAVVGAILGLGLAGGDPSFPGLGRIVLCWAASPFTAGLLAMALYFLLGRLLRRLRLHFLTYDRLMRNLLIITGAYGAFALGANNVPNVTSVFYQAGMVSLDQALLIGGLSIGLGALTFSRRVMRTVGGKIIPMDAFTAFIVVLAHSLSLDLFARVGVPVSSSQAVVGAVIGLGLLKNARTINLGTIRSILAGWLITPLLAAGLAWLAARHLL